MFRFSQRSSGGKVYPTVLGFLGFEFNSYDKATDSPSAKKVLEKVRLEAPPSGWEGLKEMFSKQEPNGISMELLSCLQLGLCSFVTGFVLGGIDNTKFTVQEFKERNQATIFKNTFEAQRSIQDKVAKEFFKGGIKLGLKCSSFLFCYSIITTSLSVYRGKTSVTDFMAGGAITGGFSTLNRGLAGTISGATIGLILGTITGTVLVGTLYASGIDMNEVRMWQYHQYQKRIRVENKAFLKDTERSSELHDQVAHIIMTPEEKDHGRVVDELKVVTKSPEESYVVIPIKPPESMFRN